MEMSQEDDEDRYELAQLLEEKCTIHGETKRKKYHSCPSSMCLCDICKADKNSNVSKCHSPTVDMSIYQSVGETVGEQWPVGNKLKWRTKSSKPTVDYSPLESQKYDSV